jgi:hypothetical protein
MDDEQRQERETKHRMDRQQRPAQRPDVEPHERAAGDPCEPRNKRPEGRERDDQSDGEPRPASAPDGPRHARPKLCDDGDREQTGEEIVGDEQPGRPGRPRDERHAARDGERADQDEEQAIDLGRRHASRMRATRFEGRARRLWFAASR